MRNTTIFLLLFFGCFVGTARGQTGVISLSVTPTPLPITVNVNCAYVVIQENSATPTNAFTITLPGGSTGITYAAGVKFIFSANGGFVNGQTIGTITVGTGTVSFVGIESINTPTVPAKTNGSGGGGGGGGGGSGSVNQGTYPVIPFYNTAGVNAIVGPSNLSVGGAGLNNLIVPGTATVGNGSVAGQIQGTLQPSGCTAPGSGLIDFFLGDSVTGLPLVGSGTNPCEPIAVQGYAGSFPSLTVSGNVGTATLSATGQITSTETTGTAPLVIASTTNVPNLNASSLNGANFAAPGPIGSTTPSTGAFSTASGTTGTFSTSVISPNVSGQLYIDGNTYAKAAGGINAADAALSTASGSITINYPGSYCDTQVLLSNNHTLIFGPGTYVLNIAGADSNSANVTWGIVGAGSNQTEIKSCPTSNLDVITDQNFGSLTGGTNFYGVYHPIIRGLTIDGNKANETAGFGIRLYGRALYPNDLLVQNSFQDGTWWEWGGTAVNNASGTQFDGQLVNVESDYNGGNGFTFKGTSGGLQTLNTLVAHNNGGWGVQTFNAISIASADTYQNSSGGCDAEANGGFTFANVTCSTATGWGLIQKTGAGQITMSSGYLAGGIPLELDSTSGGVINGAIANPAASTTCLKINGGGSYVINVQFLNCTTNLIAFTSEVTPSIITGTSTASPPNTFSGTPSNGDYINIYNPFSAASRFFQLSTSVVNVPSLVGSYFNTPVSYGNTLLVTGNNDPHFQYATSSGCTTPAVAGSPCASPITITWTTSFADTSYFPVCSGNGIGSGEPGAVYTITKAVGTMTVNYAAITGVAASYSTVTCWAVHN